MLYWVPPQDGLSNANCQTGNGCFDAQHIVCIYLCPRLFVWKLEHVHVCICVSVCIVVNVSMCCVHKHIGMRVLLRLVPGNGRWSGNCVPGWTYHLLITTFPQSTSHCISLTFARILWFSFYAGDKNKFWVWGFCNWTSPIWDWTHLAAKGCVLVCIKNI